MRKVQDLTDDELAREWRKLANMRLGDMSKEDLLRLKSVDQEGFNRKYKIKS